MISEHKGFFGEGKLGMIPAVMSSRAAAWAMFVFACALLAMWMHPEMPGTPAAVGWAFGVCAAMACNIAEINFLRLGAFDKIAADEKEHNAAMIGIDGRGNKLPVAGSVLSLLICMTAVAVSWNRLPSPLVMSPSQESFADHIHFSTIAFVWTLALAFVGIRRGHVPNIKSPSARRAGKMAALVLSLASLLPLFLYYEAAGGWQAPEFDAVSMLEWGLDQMPLFGMAVSALIPLVFGFIRYKR